MSSAEFPLYKVTQIQAKWLDGLPRFVLPVRSILEIPDGLKLPDGKLIVFIAADARDYDRLAVGMFAKRIVALDCAATVGWGPDCTIVETDIDWALISEHAIDGRPERFFPTCSMREESLEDAVEFFSRTYTTEFEPDEFLAIVEDREDWVNRVARAMAAGF